MSKKKLKKTHTLLINNSIIIPLGSLVYTMKRNLMSVNMHGSYSVNSMSNSGSTVDLEVTFKAACAKSNAFSKIVNTELNLKILNDTTWQIKIEMNRALMMSYQKNNDTFTAKFRGIRHEGVSIGNGLVRAVKRIRNKRLTKRSLNAYQKKNDSKDK